ncbi:Uncharacterized Fe-S protein [Serratia fonticola]|uniref:Uncharacterized Fe-S protein n=1 Tax=Serratia fonticola TaxID=47917 RepID=A0A4U9V2D2_SERFO|nr:Uncharacterized Fe-S protein [Serratia fonticola]
MITLSRLYVHPVKSLRGLQLSHAQVASHGLAFDRSFMITEPDGTFITARQYPQMVLFTPALLADGLFLTAPDGESAAIRFVDFAPRCAADRGVGQPFHRVDRTGGHQQLAKRLFSARGPATLGGA